MRQIFLRVVKYDGSTLQPQLFVAEALRIFSPHNITVRWTYKIATPQESIDDLGDDLDLCFGVFTSDPENVKARVGMRSPLRGHVPVAFVRALKKRTGTLTYNPEPSGPMSAVGFTSEGLCAVTNQVRQLHVLAHEVGHFFLGPGHSLDRSNLMWNDPNRTSNSKQLTSGQSRAIRDQLV